MPSAAFRPTFAKALKQWFDHPGIRPAGCRRCSRAGPGPEALKPDTVDRRDARARRPARPRSAVRRRKSGTPSGRRVGLTDTETEATPEAERTAVEPLCRSDAGIPPWEFAKSATWSRRVRSAGGLDLFVQGGHGWLQERGTGIGTRDAGKRRRDPRATAVGRDTRVAGSQSNGRAASSHGDPAGPSISSAGAVASQTRCRCLRRRPQGGPSAERRRAAPPRGRPSGPARASSRTGCGAAESSRPLADGETWARLARA
jgi:hypothetical protein